MRVEQFPGIQFRGDESNHISRLTKSYRAEGDPGFCKFPRELFRFIIASVYILGIHAHVLTITMYEINQSNFALTAVV